MGNILPSLGLLPLLAVLVLSELNFVLIKCKKYKRQPGLFGAQKNLVARISSNLDFNFLSLETGPIYCLPV